jgi:putative addiction module killer protein
MTKINAYVIEHFLSPNEGRDLYLEWLIRLRDTQAKVAVIRRVARMETGNFGDFKFCRDGVLELRVDVGAGYRVYYALAGLKVVLLLCGGDKRSQQGDMDRAVESWKIWQKENKR